MELTLDPSHLQPNNVDTTPTAAMIDQVIQPFMDSESVPGSVPSLPDEDQDQADEVVPTYDEAFPPLGGGAGGMAGAALNYAELRGAPAAAPARHRVPVVKQPAAIREVTVLFHIPQLELQSGDYTKAVNRISTQTATQVDITKSRDGNMTVMVTGKAGNVNQAKVLLQRDLQTNAAASISIPKEHHKNIIGKSRKNLELIQKETATVITIPPQGKNDDTIKIEGSKDGIEKAIHRMKIISDEQFARHRESVILPRKFYPWIKGGRKTSTLEQLQKESGCRINVPPMQADNEEVIVTGERDRVIACIDMLQKRYQYMEDNFSSIQVEVRQTQHKYIERGGGIQDIFDRTDVWVEIPSDGSQTIKLFGVEDKLSVALSLLFEKANSIKTCDIECPAWLFKFVIGKKGEKIRELSDKYPKTTINCQSERNLISIDAPHEEFDAARLEVSSLVKELINTRSRTVLKIDHKLHKHLIGKAGSNINKIKQDTGVNITIPKEDGTDIEIVGSPEGVARAREMLLEQARKMENEATVELIIEQRWHRILIGNQGDNIKKIRVQYPEVQVSFPANSSANSSNGPTKNSNNGPTKNSTSNGSGPTKKDDSDKVVLRGPRQDVEKVSALLKKQLNIIVDENYTMKVPILKNHHRYIIGKGGVNIKRVKEETNTRIDLPAENADSDLIVITGRKEDVDAARRKLLAIQSELEGIHEEEILIDPKLHTALIGAKGRIIRSIVDESGTVQVSFPSADNPSEKVTIRGEKVDVLKAKEKLLSLAQERQLESFVTEVQAKAEYHRFLIGKKGANVLRLKKEFGVNYAFPRPEDKDQDTISIMGRKEQVIAAAENLRKTIAELENTTEDELPIEAEYFRKATSRSTMETMTAELGGIKIVPRPSSNTVKISGPKTCVEAFKLKMAAMIDDLKAQVTVMVEIPRQHHRDVIGAAGHNVRTLQARWEVQISFPPAPQRTGGKGAAPPAQDVAQVADPPATNGHCNGEEGAITTAAGSEDITPDPLDLIKLVGKPDNCEQVRLALLDLIPVTEDVEIPFEYHRMLIGKSGESIRAMMDEFDVFLQVPGTQTRSSVVVVRGHRDKVERCRERLLELVTKWDEEREDRALRSYSLNLTVDPRHHSKIIGRKGAVINKIKTEHGVIIRMPDRNAATAAEQDIITISGYEAAATAARDAIMRIVSELEERVTDTIEIDSRLHARLIGQKGKTIRKTMEQFGVDILFTGGETGNTVTIEGNEENVDECKEYLLDQADEMMDSLQERADLEAMHYSRSAENQSAAPQQGFFVTGAPWQQTGGEQTAPDTTDLAAFPGLGGGGADTSRSATSGGGGGTWGGNKKWGR